ncbi:putative disease resistance protein RGA3 [Hibiscus syriacus]|uniref:putative disease resistance protein RGA3 n=1 Tax=Hibiscus syriacus TaxID=106335 RepID=UPI001924B98C|nr:putative disease resistance protein RGA3 [Hibiscus syriacus]
MIDDDWHGDRRISRLRRMVVGIRAGSSESTPGLATKAEGRLLDTEDVLDEFEIEALRKQDRKESRIGEKRYIIGQGMTGASTGRPTPSCKHRSWNRRSGKTALAELVFNDICVHNHFELKLWVCVSEDFDLQLLVLKFVKAERGGDGDLGSKNLQQLQMALRDCLNGKSYTRRATGSKIIKGEEKQNPNLVEIGEEIVKKCNGVPLLLKTLGSMLFSKTAEREWELVKNSETWRLMEKDDEMVYVLKLSYDQLSPRLKQCFAYCLLFPKDYEFIEFGLISFWMAHGLLESSDENENPFDIGRQYLNELLSRSLFEDFNVAFLYGVFKMHHLLHDLALLVAKNECCLVNTFKEKIAPSIRHVRLINSDSSNESASDLVN